MRYLALACDYDGTIAQDGHVGSEMFEALERFTASGRKLILLTGRELEDLQSVCPRLGVFEWAVVENGAVLYHPATQEVKPLAPPPPERFVQRLRQRKVAPLSVGRSIVATWKPHEVAVLETIRDLGLEMQVIFNKGAVMVLPAGVNKATGLAAALKEMGLSPHNIVGVGDAENDHAFLAICECSVAVANALSTLRERVDFVTHGVSSRGVRQLIDELIQGDLRNREYHLDRHHLLLGMREDGTEVLIPPHGYNLLVAGPSASGKSTVATAIMERLAEKKYQFCVIDPEGDYGGLASAIHLGTKDRAPSAEEVLEVLSSPEQNLVVNLLGLPLGDRPPFFRDLLPRLQELRARTGRPHWVLIDEVHHLLPSSWDSAPLTLPQVLGQVLMVTVHPDEVAPAVLTSANAMLAVGQGTEDTFRRFCKPLEEKVPKLPDGDLQPGEVLFWKRGEKTPPFRVKIAPGK